MQVDIDADELNSHECMATLCGLFQHLHDENIYQSSNSPVPEFITSIRKELEDPNTSRNVKLFLVKAIENKREIFKPYANSLFAPIMKVIVDGITGSNINYFVTDLVSIRHKYCVGVNCFFMIDCNVGILDRGYGKYRNASERQRTGLFPNKKRQHRSTGYDEISHRPHKILRRTVEE